MALFFSHDCLAIAHARTSRLHAFNRGTEGLDASGMFEVTTALKEEVFRALFPTAEHRCFRNTDSLPVYAYRSPRWPCKLKQGSHPGRIVEKFLGRTIV